MHPGPAPRIFPRLAASTPGDASEREAERVADEVTRPPSARRGEGGCVGCGGAASAGGRPETKIQRAADGAGTAVPEGVAAEIGALSGRGRALGAAERQALEPRFGFDFGRVRVHDDPVAGRLAQRVGARAFTVGSDIAFAPGEFAPATPGGRRLLAHELTHVVQQGTAGARLQRTPAPTPAPVADPLCTSYDFAAKKTEIEGHIAALKAAPDVEVRLKLVQALKWIRRCGTETETAEIRAALEAGLGAEQAAAVWAESGTAFGGYRGTYPAYYGNNAKSRVTSLGMQANAHESFPMDLRSAAERAAYPPRAKKAAAAAAAGMTGTDLLYFYGHQFAQYLNPGMFSNGDMTRFIDLRALAEHGAFGRVKLVVSTSCATLCTEAANVFSGVFPNAVILGYRKSAPIDGGKVRDAFDAGIKGLKKPLLLDQPVDVDAIIGVWKNVVAAMHPKEAARLPGFYKGGVVHYLEMDVWKSMPATDPANECFKKGSDIGEAAH